MRYICLVAVIIAAQNSFAHELDRENVVSAEQLALAKHLPATTVVRIKKDNPSVIEVAHLKEPLKPAHKIKNMKFEKLALNAETTGIAFSSENELDATSSTSAWVFGFAAGGGRGGYGNGYGYGGGYGYGSGYSNRPYYNNWYYDQAIQYGAEYYPGAAGEPRWNSYNGGVGSSEYQKNGCLTNYSCPQAFYPSYQYSGYRYDYAPYYTYSDRDYNYAYTGWGY